MDDPFRSDRVKEDIINKEGMEKERNVMCERCNMLFTSSSKSNIKRDRYKWPNMCLKSSVSLDSCLNVLVLVWTFLAFLVTDSSGFNLDTSKAVRYDGPRQGSYFGFTVEMMNKDSNNKWILFGAPKDRNPNLASATNPGAIYKTTFTNLGTSFDRVYIDDKEDMDTADFNGTIPTFKHGRDNQWLGASLDVNENQGVVICASRWYNRYFEDKENTIFMNGLCYLVPLDFRRDNIKKVPALINKAKQTKGVEDFDYGMGCLGSAAHYTRSGNDVLLGTPGLWDWTGGFVDLRHDKGYITQHEKPPTDLNEMAGYALSSGIYFRDGVTYFAIGAPRQDLIGAVFLISSIRKSVQLSEADHVLNGSIDTGISMPVNSFFGATLCTADVNNDGLDDLFVGAPMFSRQSTKDVEYVEEGAVFVFFGGEKDFQASPAVLRGSETKYARFGSAISSIGDLNNDNYNDIVIGAPYENNMEGSIFIYNGCKTGIFTKYSQRIMGSSVLPGIQSFGAALSKSYSMNDDNVNDIAVGAYLSDKAFLLYGQPVINMQLTIDSSVELIDKDSRDTCNTVLDSKVVSVPCFQLKVCTKYNNINIAYIDVKVVMVLDLYKGNKYFRISFEENRGNEISEDLRVFSGEQECTRENRNIFIRSTSDLVTPVIVSARLEEENIQSSTDIKPTLNVFDGNEPDQPLLKKRKRLDFLKDCPNNICETDLHLDVEPTYTKHSGYFVLGTSTLDVAVTITKSGNPSYGSNLFIIIPKEVLFRKAEKMSGEPEISCGYVEEATNEGDFKDDSDMDDDIYQLFTIPEVEENEKLISCSFGNPMSEDEGVKFRLSLVVPGLLSNTMLPFRFNATTLSTETGPMDNVAAFVIEAKNKVFTEFNGVSRPAFITMKDDENIYEASHILELSNYGPSILPEAELTIRFPQVQLNGKAQLYLNQTTWSCRHPCTIHCAFPDSEVISPQVHFGERGPTYYIDESPTVVRTGETVALTEIDNADCAKKTCTRYECSLRNISPRESAVVSLEFVINKDLLKLVGGKVTVKTDSYVRFGAKHRLITNETEHSTMIYTDVQPKSPPPEPVAWWIILVSVLAGLILIAIIILIMWKCGFFVRKKRDELEKRMQVEGQVMVQPDDNDIEKKPV